MCQLWLKNSPKVGLGENIKLSLSLIEREREESGKEMKILQCSSSLSGDNCGHVHSHLIPKVIHFSTRDETSATIGKVHVWCVKTICTLV